MCLGGAVAPARAQGETAADHARYHWSIFHVTPILSLSNFGTDSNVFNSSTDPERDFTATFGPGADVWVNLAQSMVSGRVAVEYVYYRKFDSERAFNTNNALRWDIPLGRLTPFVAGTYNNSTNRRSYEINTRPRLLTESLDVGTNVRLSGRTSVTVSAGRSGNEYDQTDFYNGENLAVSLNHITDNERVTAHYSLTPLTTFVLDTQALQDRFDYDSLRDSNSIKVLPGFELKPAALISGSVFVGVRRLESLNAAVPDYLGAIARVDAAFVNGSRLWSAQVSRDVDFSYLDVSPYYTLNNSTVTLTQRVTRTWDLRGTGSFQKLDYHEIITTPPVDHRTDRIFQYGGGFGYRLGPTMRLGLNVAQVNHHSTDQVNYPDYAGLRVGLSVEYGTTK